MTLAPVPAVLTVEEAAEVLAVSRGTAYEAVRTGGIPSVRIGRCIRVPRHALEQLLNGTPQTNGATATNGDAGKAGDDGARLGS